jgi:hypothetical protein
MPHAAVLEPEVELGILDFRRLDATSAAIAVSFLQYAFRSPLWGSADLWSAGRRYYQKTPLDGGRSGSGVDAYPGFIWGVAVHGDGRVFLTVDTVVKYIDHEWLPRRVNDGDPRAYLHRHCLYHFGHDWYMVQLWAIADRSVAEQQFTIHDGAITNVLAYTRERWRASMPLWIRDLAADSPAIIYRYPGNEQERYGALALCKLALSTAEQEAAGLHRYSILDPRSRFTRIGEIVARYFQHASLAGRLVRVVPNPLEIDRRVFPIPALRFGSGRVLAVRSSGSQGASDVVKLEHFSQSRLRLLLDRKVGPIDRSPFDVQYLFVPQSLPRAINEDFEARFVAAMREVSGQADYRVRRIVYDDRDAKSLHRQITALKRAIAENGISRGYALLVLPRRADPGLHNYMKQEMWPDLQFQCATAERIRSFYEVSGNGEAHVLSEREGRFVSYVRNCALGMMIVNRKWLWSLATPLHYDVYVGIDVLNGMAGFTFIYQNGERMIFRNYRCKQRERLTSRQLREILVKHLREDVRALGIRPRSIVVHRDGRSFGSEFSGPDAAITDLQFDGTLPSDLVVGVVDIRKTTADCLRIVEGENESAFGNPTFGSHYVSGTTEGVVCTTGWPFRFPGTAKPLAVSIVKGPLNIEWVLEDLFALAQLAFAAPDKCSRLPATVKLSDDLLEPIASEIDEEEALYEDEGDPEEKKTQVVNAAPRTAG